MTRHPVVLSDDALQDLGDICDYIAQHDSVAKAVHVLDRIQQAIDALEMHPLRGSPVQELLMLGTDAYRQIFFKPYRIVYFVDDPAIHVLLIADGRRDLRTMLERRLLGA
jgi:toxin ParE1/3/4